MNESKAQLRERLARDIEGVLVQQVRSREDEDIFARRHKLHNGQDRWAREHVNTRRYHGNTGLTPRERQVSTWQWTKPEQI